MAPVPLTFKVIQRAMGAQGMGHILTPTEVHENEHFPYITAAHTVDTGVNVTNDVLVPRQVSLLKKS